MTRARLLNGRTVVLALALAAGVAAGAWFLLQPGVPAGAARVGPGTYRLSYAFSLDMPSASGPARATTALSGHLDLAPGAQEGTFAARVRVGSWQANDLAQRLTDLPKSGTEAQLARPFLVRVDDEGRVADVRFAEGLSVSVRSVLHTVASGLQYVRPADVAASRWSAFEEDVNGPYRADYAVEKSEVLKTWALSRDPDDETGEEQAGPKGDVKVRFGLRDGTVNSADYVQKGDAAPGRDPKQRALFTLSFRVDRDGDVVDPGFATALDETKLAPLDPSTIEVAEAGEAPPRPFNEVLKAVQEVPEKRTMEQHAALRSELTRAIAADDTSVPVVEKLLRKGKTSEGATTILVEGLVGARTEKAETAVLSVLADNAAQRELQLRFLQAVMLAGVPTPRVVGALGELVTDAKDKGYRAEVAMAYAATSSALLDTNPTVAQAGLSTLAREAEAALTGKPPPPAGVRINWLNALGNAGEAGTRPLIVSSLLTDPDDLVRAAAADALRFLEPGTVREDMERAMASEGSIHVRYALTQAARTMGPAAMETFVNKALLFDASEYVRLGAAYTMATWVMDAPQLRVRLSEALAQEKSREVQESLRNYLQPNRVGDGVLATPIRSNP